MQRTCREAVQYAHESQGVGHQSRNEGKEGTPSRSLNHGGSPRTLGAHGPSTCFRGKALRDIQPRTISNTILRREDDESCWPCENTAPSRLPDRWTCGLWSLLHGEGRDRFGPGKKNSAWSRGAWLRGCVVVSVVDTSPDSYQKLIKSIKCDESRRVPLISVAPSIETASLWSVRFEYECTGRILNTLKCGQ